MKRTHYWNRVKALGERRLSSEGLSVRRVRCAFLRRAEVVLTSIMVRVLVSRVSLDRTLDLLDRFPAQRPPDCLPFHFPEDRQLRLAGACLGRSLVRSQYLRNRGIPHHIVIGTAGTIGSFRAHAWIAPYEDAPEGFLPLRSIDRFADDRIPRHTHDAFRVG